MATGLNLCHDSPSSIRRTRSDGPVEKMKQLKQIGALAMLTAMALWQASTFAHLLLIPHEILYGGTIIAFDPQTGEEIPDVGDPESGDSECPFLAKITTARSMASADVVGIAPIDLAARLEPTDPLVAPRAAAELYRLSPSHSPPGLA